MGDTFITVKDRLELGLLLLTRALFFTNSTKYVNVVMLYHIKIVDAIILVMT